jgi:hypothetical protein
VGDEVSIEKWFYVPLPPIFIMTRQRQKCEVWSRVVGYLRPVDCWNDGKKAEFKDRKEFIVN